MTRVTFSLILTGRSPDAARVLDRLAAALAEAGHSIDDEWEYLPAKDGPGLRLFTAAAVLAALMLYEHAGAYMIQTDVIHPPGDSCTDSAMPQAIRFRDGVEIHQVVRFESARVPMGSTWWEKATRFQQAARRQATRSLRKMK
jgi:hypothetical protein